MTISAVINSGESINLIAVCCQLLYDNRRFFSFHWKWFGWTIFEDFSFLFIEKLMFHTNYLCKNFIKIKLHLHLVYCVKPYNSFENRMNKCTWNGIEIIFLKIDCIWACANFQTLPELKSNAYICSIEKKNQFDYHQNPKKYNFFLFEEEWVKTRRQLRIIFYFISKEYSYSNLFGQA